MANYRDSQRQERRLAKQYGGQTSAASGAFWSRKGDVRTDKYLIEAKITDAKGFRVTKQMLDKIEREAVLDGRIPRLDLSIQGDEWVMIRKGDLDGMDEQLSSPEFTEDDWESASTMDVEWEAKQMAFEFGEE